MIQSFIFKSENNNLYIYDDQSRLSILINPELEKVYNELTDSDPYYLKKYEYLKSHGFFEKSKLVDFRMLEASMIKDNIVNTQQIVFEVTDSCNLKCTYCALGELYEGFDERNGKKINTRYAINLLKYIFNLKPKNTNNKMFISFYGGEALLNMNFIKKIVKAVDVLNAEKGIQIQYSMTTNATLLHKYIDFLVVNNFVLLISLDGNEKNNSYRVFVKNKENSFQNIVDNLDMIKRDYPDYFYTHINFNSVLHDRNSIKKIYEFIFMRYNIIPRISELNLRNVKLENRAIVERMYNNKRKNEDVFQKERSDLLNITHSELSSYKELINFLKYQSVNCYMSNINSLLPADRKQLPTGTCTPFSKKIFLTNQNRLLPCEKISYKYSMGKVSEKIEINITEIAKQYNQYYEHIKKICQTCYAYRFCGACLLQMENIEDIGTKEFMCKRYKDLNSFKMTLRHIFSFLEMYPDDFSEILENVTLE